MRKSVGKLVRRYFYDKRLGERRVVAIYRDGVKIWPSLADTVYSCVLDVAALEGAVDWAYWLHALDAVAGGAREGSYMRLSAGGRDYMLGSTFGAWYLAEFDGRATVVFGDNGPLVERLRVGDEVVVEVCVPARRVVVLNNFITGGGLAVDVGVPLLPGSVVGFEQACGRRKAWSHAELVVHGAPSGKLLLQRAVDKQSRSWVGYSWAVPGVVEGDRGWNAAFSLSGLGYLRNGFVVYPGFVKRFVLGVSVVTRHG